MRLFLLLLAAVGARARLAPRARLTGGRRLSDSSSFAQLVKMTASDAAANDYFGTSVAVDGGTIWSGLGATTTAAHPRARPTSYERATAPSWPS